MSPRPTPKLEYKTPVAQRLHVFFADMQFKEIAEKIGMAKSQTANILRGMYPPNFDILNYIAENGGDVNYILTGKESKTSVESIDSRAKNDNFLREVLQNWTSMTRKQKGEIATRTAEMTTPIKKAVPA